MDIITQTLKLKDVYPDKAKSLAAEIGKPEDELLFVRKGLVADDLSFNEGERAAISYITTGAVDRDGEIVDPAGADLTDYQRNPVVLWCHDYRELPLGKNMWIKADQNGLIAKTQYASHEMAEKVYQYRKEGFPLAQSIGFMPIEWQDFNPNENAKGARRTYSKWKLLEYSDVPVPANPEAVNIAVSKGLLPDNASKTEVGANFIQIDLPEQKDAGITSTSYPGKIDWVVTTADTTGNITIVAPEVEKIGAVLSRKNKTLVTNAIAQMQEAVDALEALLDAAEPQDVDEEDEKVITEIHEKCACSEPVDVSKIVAGVLSKQPALDANQIADRIFNKLRGRATA